MKKAYRVKIGLHIEDDKTYKKDEVVVSERDLPGLFPQKFVDLGEVKEGTSVEVGAPLKKESEPLPPTKPTSKKGGKVKSGADDFEDD